MQYVWRVGLALVLATAVTTAAAEKMKTTTVQGKVTAVAADSVTIAHGTESLTFTVDAATKVVGKGLTTKTNEKAAKGEKLLLTDSVTNGDSVAVTYHDMEGKMHATVIKVTQKALNAK